MQTQMQTFMQCIPSGNQALQSKQYPPLPVVSSIGLTRQIEAGSFTEREDNLHSSVVNDKTDTDAKKDGEHQCN